jgi:DnaK suppressor protein
MVDVLSTVVLPKLKGLSEKNAKKMVQVSHKALVTISKKYHKLIQEQEADAAKEKAKQAKVAKKTAEKEVKKKAKIAKKESESKQLAMLLVKEAKTSPKAARNATKPAAKKIAAKSVAKPVAKVRIPRAKK